MVDTSDSFKTVRWYDPELEPHFSVAELMEYQQTHDLDLLAIPPDAKPIVFTCRLLSRDQRRHVYSLSSDEVKWEVAFAYGVTSLDNLPRNGRLESVAPRRHGSKRAPLTDEDLNALGLGDQDIHEIGRVILEKSRLGKGVPLRLEPLPSSQRAWVSVATLAASRRVEQQRDSETGQDDSSS